MKTYRIYNFYLNFVLVFFTSGIVAFFAPQSARAGFEWTPASPPKAVEATPVSPVEAIEVVPLQPQAPSTASAAPAGVLVNPYLKPAASSGMKTLEMEALESDPKQVIRVKNFQEKPAGPVTINPYPDRDSTAQHRRAAPPMPLAPPKQAEPSNYPEVVGFGADLPLALALRQVAPAHYSFSFGDGVNPGYRVSWNGGRPWNEVLNDMVAPLGLSAVIFEKSIRITSNGSPAPMKAQAQPPQTGGGNLDRKNITDPGEKS